MNNYFIYLLILLLFSFTTIISISTFYFLFFYFILFYLFFFSHLLFSAYVHTTPMSTICLLLCHSPVCCVYPLFYIVLGCVLVPLFLLFSVCFNVFIVFFTIFCSVVLFSFCGLIFKNQKKNFSQTTIFKWVAFTFSLACYS